MSEQWLRKSGRTLERRWNTNAGNPRFWVSFADGSRLPTEDDAAVNFVIHNSDFDGVVEVLVRNGAIIDIAGVCSQCRPGHAGADGLCARHGKRIEQ